MHVRAVVDLSHRLGASTQVYPGDPMPQMSVASTIERDGFNLLHITMGSQSGTHCDAPYHFEADGLRIDEMDLALFAGPGVVAHIADPAPRHRIEWREIEPVAEQLGPGVILLLRTGWPHHYGTDTYFANPFLDSEACQRILDLGVRTICIDAINLDETPDADHPGEGFPVHHKIARAGGIIGENFTHLDRIDFPDPFVTLFPLRLNGADGAPVRAVAMQLEAP